MVKIVINLHKQDASLALILAAVWTVIVQLSMAIIGTFIIKRFSTSFSVGFIEGLVIIVAQQNLLLAITFWNSRRDATGSTFVFTNFAFTLFAVYCIFAAILGQFQDVIDMPVIDDTKSTDRSRKSVSSSTSSVGKAWHILYINKAKSLSIFSYNSYRHAVSSEIKSWGIEFQLLAHCNLLR